MCDKQSYVTLKDHKDSFPNHIKCRLINPTKTDMGKVSKKFLTKIVAKVRETTRFNHWKNSESVIDWFESLEGKEKMTFIQFDIKDFYPTISEELLRNSINFAKQMVTITQDEIEIILQCRNSILFNEGEPWLKKGPTQFDVTMGSWDGAEICELVGLYLLSQLHGLDKRVSVGLYRDDGLCASSLTPRQTEILAKKLSKILKNNGLIITLETNVKSVNFLDINLDLQTGIYKPYIKPNDKPVYVHQLSNHPPGILQNIPYSVNRRLSTISKNEEVFKKATPLYQESLRNSGYSFELKFEKPDKNKKTSKNRKRRVTYFNPPYSQHVQTKIGEQFFKILDKCFPKSHPLSKVINRNTVKLGYKCMPNIKKKISQHNRRVQQPVNQQDNLPKCNCRQPPCPLNGECISAESVIYRATVLENNINNNNNNRKTETYTGLTKNNFKNRYNGHQESFRKKKKQHSTTLSTHIWDLKEKRTDFEIKWSIIEKGKKFDPSTRKCMLCLKEKYHIVFNPDGASLNKRSELFSVCRHRHEKLLVNIE